jgi:hypothetical protein
MTNPGQGEGSGGVACTSSTPSQFDERQVALFRQVLTLLETANEPYAVAGAFALRQHTGICRFTKDLDIFLTPPTACHALKLLHEQGLECEIPDPVWLAKVHRDGYFVDLITGMSNGAITVEDTWIERALPARVCDVESRVLAPEEMLASKLFVTRRERFDGADIAHIIFASGGQLDWNRILQLAGEHWGLVLWSLMLFQYVYPAHGDYIPKPLWKDLVARLGRELDSPNPAARFRGSLIDDAMFAIDMEDWGLHDLQSEYRGRRIPIELHTDRGSV